PEDGAIRAREGEVGGRGGRSGGAVEEKRRDQRRSSGGERAADLREAPPGLLLLQMREERFGEHQVGLAGCDRQGARPGVGHLETQAGVVPESGATPPNGGSMYVR